MFLAFSNFLMFLDFLKILTPPKIQKHLKKIENSESINEIFSLVEKINSLLDIATTIKNSNILLREVSFNQNEQLDARKLSRLPRINNIGGMRC